MGGLRNTGRCQSRLTIHNTIKIIYKNSTVRIKINDVMSVPKKYKEA